MLRIFVFLLLGAWSAAAVHAAPGDTAVLQAQQAFAARKLVNLERAARDVPADHVLAPYVEYWRLTLASRAEDARLTDFLARYPGSRVAEMLRADWLKSLGAREAWPAMADGWALRNGARLLLMSCIRPGWSNVAMGIVFYEK